MDLNTWNGLTGKEVREKIQSIESQANATDEKVNGLLDGNSKIKSEYLPSYIDDIVEGYYNAHNFYYDEKYTDQIEHDKGKIYVDLTDDKKVSYRYSGSQYIKIVNGDEIQQRLDNFSTVGKVANSIEKIVAKKVDKDGSKVLSDNNYTNNEKNKFTIVATLPSKEYADKVYYLKQDNGSYPKGLYYHNGTGWQRVGGLL